MSSSVSMTLKMFACGGLKVENNFTWYLYSEAILKLAFKSELYCKMSSSISMTLKLFACGGLKVENNLTW